MKLFTHYQNVARQKQPAIVNWRENSINEQLFYSFRQTHYTRENYPAELHYHDYYEVVVFQEGDIRYLCESDLFEPKYGDVIVIPPGKLHMSMLNAEETTYIRHVFYLYPSAFDAWECGVLTSFLRRASTGRIMTSEDSVNLMNLLEKMDHALTYGQETPENALALGYVIQIFYLLNQECFERSRTLSILPTSVSQIQRFLDEHFTEISSVKEVAAHFFYSREYVSRLFKQHLHTSVTDYLTKKRIAHSQTLIAQGMPLGDAGLQSGFNNVNTFIRAFRSITGMTPSDYRKAMNEL